MANKPKFGPNTDTVVQLSGEDGNVYNIIGRCVKAARKGGWTTEQVEAFKKWCFNEASDYDDVMQCAMVNFDVR